MSCDLFVHTAKCSFKKPQCRRISYLTWTSFWWTHPTWTSRSCSTNTTKQQQQAGHQPRQRTCKTCQEIQRAWRLGVLHHHIHLRFSDGQRWSTIFANGHVSRNPWCLDMIQYNILWWYDGFIWLYGFSVVISEEAFETWRFTENSGVEWQSWVMLTSKTPFHLSHFLVSQLIEELVFNLCIWNEFTSLRAPSFVMYWADIMSGCTRTISTSPLFTWVKEFNDISLNI